MPARIVVDDPQAELERRREQDRLRKQHQRRREREASHGTPVTGRSTGHGTPPPENGHPSSLRHVTPPLPPDPPFSPALSTKEPPEEVVARIAARLQSFGRGYTHDQARLEKLIRDFPHLDVEEEVADGLDFLDRPENRKRVNSLGFHRNGCKRAEARRLADLAKAAAPATNGYSGNGVYHQPQSQQHNRQPDAPRLLEGELVPISRVDFERYKAERRAIPLEQRTAQLKGGST